MKRDRLALQRLGPIRTADPFNCHSSTGGWRRKLLIGGIDDQEFTSLHRETIVSLVNDFIRISLRVDPCKVKATNEASIALSPGAGMIPGRPLIIRNIKGPSVGSNISLGR